jgi:hypothetical protein
MIGALSAVILGAFIVSGGIGYVICNYIDKLFKE